MAIVGSLGGWYAIANIVANKEFRCKLTADTLDCYCPVKGVGETFTVKLSDITKLEKEVWEDSQDSYRWYIWEGNGDRHWLTSNYGNPCERIIDRIQKLNPKVIQIST